MNDRTGADMYYSAIFLPSRDISTALLFAKAFLFLSAAARMCLRRMYMISNKGVRIYLSSFVASFFLIFDRSASFW